MGLQEQYDSYKSKYRHYRDKKARLKSAYKQIGNVKAIHKMGEKKLSQCTKGTKWKGEQAKKFSTMLDELSMGTDTHRNKIDAIQDAVNIEANKANDSMWHYDSLAGNIWTQLQNLTNG